MIFDTLAYMKYLHSSDREETKLKRNLYTSGLATESQRGEPGSLKCH